MSASSLPEPKWRQHLSSVKWFLIDQWFLLALGCLVLLASQVQVPASLCSSNLFYHGVYTSHTGTHAEL